MFQLPFALQFLLVIASGRVNRRQQLAVEYLLEENPVLRAADPPICLFLRNHLQA